MRNTEIAFILDRSGSMESMTNAAISGFNEFLKAQQVTLDDHGLMKCYGRGGRTGAQAACLIRDTLKVSGIPGKLAPPIAALFWVDPAHPEAGGTGHTIRACRLAGIPVIFQNHWETWLNRWNP